MGCTRRHVRVSVSSTDRVVIGTGVRCIVEAGYYNVSVSSTDRVVIGTSLRPTPAPAPGAVSVSSTDRVVIGTDAIVILCPVCAQFQYPLRIEW